MAITEELSEKGLGVPLGIGLAVATVAAGPGLVKAGRPLVKSAIKGYLKLQEYAKTAFAETAERMQDLYAEAKHEHEQEATGAQEEPEPEAKPAKKQEAPKE